MTITQALALRIGQRVCDIHPMESAVREGRVVSVGRRVGILWDDGRESFFDRAHMHFIHILVRTKEIVR